MRLFGGMVFKSNWSSKRFLALKWHGIPLHPTSAKGTRSFIPAMHAASDAKIRLGLMCRTALLTIAAMIASSFCPQGSMALAATEAETLEYRIKAASLYRFVGYVEWPEASFARPDAPVTVAVTGAEPLVAELVQVVAGRTVNNRPFTVKRLKVGESLAGVHVLFIGKDEIARIPQFSQMTQSRSILTVTESKGALTQGSVINFVLADWKVRFEISLDSAEKSGLKMSSRLLSVALQVHTGVN